MSQLERMAEQFFEENKISFSDSEFSIDGAGHNRALHMTTKCEGHYIRRVMIDDGSGVDICPISTLQGLNINTNRIRANNVFFRAFDGLKRDTIWEIDLVLTIKPVKFHETLQVLDMETSYNFLLGRSWIHTTRAIPSTLHQMVKHDNQ